MSDRESRPAGDDLLERLADLHAGVLDDEQEARLRAEIAGDGEAQELLTALERARREFAALGADDAYLEGLDDPAVGALPADAAARLDAALAREVRDRDVGGETRGPATTPDGPADELAAARARRRHRLLAAAAVAAVVLLGVVTAVVGTLTGTGPGGDDLRATPGDSTVPGSISTIATGVAAPGRDNVVSPDGRFLYISDGAAGQIVVVGLREPVRRTVPLPGEVEGMAVSADGDTLWVSTTEAGTGGPRAVGRLTRIDVLAGAARQTREVVGRQAGAVAASPTGALLWSLDDEIAFVDPDGLAPLGSVPLPGRADQLEVTADGTRVYVNVSDGVVGVDLRTRAVVFRNPVPGREGPLRLALNPSRPLFAVSSEAPGTVALFALDRSDSFTTVPIGPSAYMSWPGNSSRLYVTSKESTEVATVDASDPSDVERLPIPANPLDIVASPDGEHVYVVYPGELRVLAR